MNFIVTKIFRNLVLWFLSNGRKEFDRVLINCVRYTYSTLDRFRNYEASPAQPEELLSYLNRKANFKFAALLKRSHRCNEKVFSFLFFYIYASLYHELEGRKMLLFLFFLESKSRSISFVSKPFRFLGKTRKIYTYISKKAIGLHNEKISLPNSKLSFIFIREKRITELSFSTTSGFYFIWIDKFRLSLNISDKRVLVKFKSVIIPGRSTFCLIQC